MGYVSVCWLQWCGWCWVIVDGRLGPGSGMVLCCYVCVSWESGLSVLMAGPDICIVCLGGYLHIFGAPSVQSCFTLSISVS